VAATGELYITYLMQGPGGGRLNGGVYVNGSALQEFGALRSEYNTGTGNGVYEPHLFYAGEAVVGDRNPVRTTSYMYVQKYTGLGSASGGTAQLWILDANDYDTVAADGTVTTAELDLNNFLTTPVLTLAGAAPTLDGTENLRIHLHDNGSSTADFVLDEIRAATTLGEAMDIPTGSGTPPSIEITEFTLTKSTSPTNTIASVTFTSGAGKCYSVFSSPDLSTPVTDGDEISSTIVGQAGTTTFAVDFNTYGIALDTPRRFFVVRENP
jgi:hypothetical protein